MPTSPAFQNVLQYIDTHLAEDLDIHRLGDVGACSKHRFARRLAFHEEDR